MTSSHSYLNPSGMENGIFQYSHLSTIKLNGLLMSSLHASPRYFKTGFSVSTCDKTTIISCHKKEFESDSQGYEYLIYDLTRSKPMREDVTHVMFFLIGFHLTQT